MVAARLTPAEHDAVAAAVAAAEGNTAGEIVTILSERSDPYHDVALHYAVAAMLAVVALFAIRPDLALDGWGEPSLASILARLLFALAAAFLAVRLLLAWMPLRLLLTPRATKSRRVRRRAVEYFKVGAERRTAARVGVLLYLSTAEHDAEIVVDEAVHAAVPPERWGDAMAALVDEVRAGRTGAGLVAAVGQIGAVLAEHFPRQEDDVNELPDRLIEL
jgi:putative membrane protein